MTQDEIIELAIQGHASTRDAIRWAMNQEHEACAEVCDKLASDWHEKHHPLECARQIRAREQA